MTLRKPRPAVVLPAPLPKAVPYPPDPIWRAWEDGQPTIFRGNMFKRQGNKIARIFTDPPGRNDV